MQLRSCRCDPGEALHGGGVDRLLHLRGQGLAGLTVFYLLPRCADHAVETDRRFDVNRVPQRQRVVEDLALTCLQRMHRAFDRSET